MSRQLSILFGAFSLLAVSLLLVLLFRYANISEPVNYDNFTQNSSSLPIANNIDSSWLEGLAQRKKTLNVYPITEIELFFGAVDNTQKIVSYRIVISDLDSYELFCIREVLEQLNLKYTLYKDSLDSKIVINNPKKSAYGDIIDKIAEYNVNIKLEKYVKD